MQEPSSAALLLSGTVATPLVGRLADIYDKKAVFFVVLGIVAAGTLLGAVATSIVVLAVGQVLQGAGLGLVPLSIGILRDTQSTAQARSGNGLVIGMSGLGSVIGLLLAGPILTVLPYNWLYWLPLGAFALLGAVGLALLAAFTAVELKVAHPLIDLRSGGRSVVITCVVAFAVGWSTYAVFLSLPTIVASSAILFLARQEGGVVLALASGLAGLGIGIGLTQAMNIMSSAVPAERVAGASGLLLVVRSIGATVGVQVSGSVLAGDPLPGTALPSWSSFSAVFVMATVVGVGAIAAGAILSGKSGSNPKW